VHDKTGTRKPGKSHFDYMEITLVSASGFVSADPEGNVYVDYQTSGAGTLDIWIAVSAFHI